MLNLKFKKKKQFDKRQIESGMRKKRKKKN